jgi:chromate reductase
MMAAGNNFCSSVFYIIYVMRTEIHFVGICGSIRKGSFNKMLLNVAATLLPENVTMEIASIRDIPLYNADLDLPAATQRPVEAQRFRDALARSEALVIVSPEYNYSIPGGLKNAIDWASRGQDSPLLHKPVAVMGATTGMWGTVRMQMAFYGVFLFLDMKPVLKPEVLIAKAPEKFDEHGNLKDEMANDLIRRKLKNLKELVEQLRPSEPLK